MPDEVTPPHVDDPVLSFMVGQLTRIDQRTDATATGLGELQVKFGELHVTMNEQQHEMQRALDDKSDKTDWDDFFLLKREQMKYVALAVIVVAVALAPLVGTNWAELLHRFIPLARWAF